MRRRAHWGVLPLLLAPIGAWALGLGDIELRSALNQPLDADIQLISATPEELADLRVSLASQETFDRYGLDRPAFLGRLSFGVGRSQSGASVIRVTSLEPITEPFVTVLVEATWARGRLLREYTVLLDPPVMLPQEAAVEPVQPAVARAPQPAEPAAVIQRPQPAAPVTAPAPAPQPVAPPVAPVTSPRPAPAPVAERSGAYGPVQRGETLWGIASRYRPAGVSMNQMMVAIYRANPAAFQGNMNILRQGARLEMPSEAALAAIGAGDATAEAIRQTAEWEGGAARQARLRLLPPEVEAPPTSTVGGRTNTQRSVETPAIGAEAPVAGSTGGTPTESERILSIQDEQLSNLQQQLADEPAVAEVAPNEAEQPTGVDALVQTGVDLEAEEITTEEPGSGIAEPTPADDGAAEEPAEPVAAPAPRAVSTQVVSSPAQPSLVSRIIGWLTAPLLWMILGLVALVGAGAVYLRSRQVESEDMTGRWESLDAEEDEDFETREATERLRSQVRVDEDAILVEEQHTQELPQGEQSADVFFDIGEEEEAAEGLPEIEVDEEPADVRVATGKFSPEATMSSQTVINLDQADPIAEADFHMAYGLYDQAADLVSKALELDPDNRDLRLKLLEVYFVWGNRDAFLDSARILRAAIGNRPDSDWDKVVIMGKQICPDEPLFAEAVGASESVDLDLAAGDSPALDMSFEDQDAAAMDFDLSGGDEEVTLEIGSAEESSDDDVYDIGEDLDIGDQTAAGLEAAFFGKSPQDPSAKTSPNLDIGADTQEAPTLEALGSEAPTMESPMLDIDTSASAELPTLQQPGLSADDFEPGDRTAEIDLDDLGLDVDDLAELTGTTTGTHRSLLEIEDEDADVLSATGVTQVLSAGDQFEAAARGSKDDTPYVRTEVLQPRDDDDDASATARFRGASSATASELGLDIDLDELSAALDGGDTVEQPRAGGFGRNSGLDLDVGFDVAGSDDPTATEQMTPLDAQTLTEVGTKLDLARAYIDMGDPEGARSILEEVLHEGDNSQQKEARGLIDAL